jgi:hypothetical protein
MSCHSDTHSDTHCNFIVYEEELPNFFDNPSTDNSFVYGSDGPLQATYTILNVEDLDGNRIGNTRLDNKIVTIPGNISMTFNSVTVIDNESNPDSKTFIYIAGTRSYEIVQGPPIVTYANTVVQNIVYNGQTYNKGTIGYTLLPEKNKLLVSISF